MAFVLDALVSYVLNKLLDKAIEDIVTALGVKSETEKLKSSVENIRVVLVDAESKKIESKAIALWLAKLREVMYDAEDLLDDFHAYVADKGAASTGKSKVQKIKNKITCMFTAGVRTEIGKRIKEINSTLERLNSQASILQLLASQPNADKKVCRYNNSRITETCSIQLDSDIVGLDDDAKKLVDLITEDNKRAHSVFAITGMGGIGKTALARKVFHHQLIQDHFNKKTVWVCVSSNCTGEYLLKKIVRFFDVNYSESCDTLDELSSKLIEVVKEKKVFIVLDDIWDSRVWEKFLRVPLSKAKKHCRILITTRNQEVAMKMNSVHMHPMTEMLPSDGWSMLCKIVFKERVNGDMNELERVGKEIVDRCKGLPLAVKVVGGVLKMKDRTIDAWTRVLSSTTWSMQDLPEDIPTSLLLSYEDLPSHLKRCFIYCSLFPQDFEFYRHILPYMWIAEGFIQKEEGTRMEESAEEYYNELVMRNLLQVTSDSVGSSKCKIHDLLHSLATFVSQNQYIYVDPKTFIGSSGSIRHRHLWLNVENMNGVPKKIIGQEYVRTLMLSTDAEIDLLSGLRRLRVLDIKGKRLQTLPTYYVRNMRQLRFLNISCIEFNSLPVSIENLKYLQTLIVSALKSRSLPKEIVELSNLRHLLVSDTPLQNMPIGFNNLKKLRVLDCFVVNESKKSRDYKPNMKELKDLSELTDLSIYHLERVANRPEAEEAAMKDKTSLKRLKLHCKPEAEEAAMEKKTSLKLPKLHCKTPDQTPRTSATTKIEEVFAGIEIPENLTELSIDGFFGKQFPDHMIGSCLRQVKSLKLERCESLEKVPSLGDMPKLETLHIKYLSSVANFGSEFYGELKFPKLKYLHLVEMAKLERIFEVKQGAFPCLIELSILYCPQLKSLGEGLQHATCLKKMTVRDVSALESIENLHSITELEISRNSSLTSVRKLPSLKKMDIEECSALKNIVDVGEQTSLSISSDDETKHQATWSTNANASEIGHPTVTDSEQTVSREENGMLANEHDKGKRKRVKVDSNFPGASSSSGTSREHVNDSMDADTT